MCVKVTRIVLRHSLFICCQATLWHTRSLRHLLPLLCSDTQVAQSPEGRTRRASPMFILPLTGQMQLQRQKSCWYLVDCGVRHVVTTQTAPTGKFSPCFQASSSQSFISLP